eukprot:scaffold166696_cov31-Tisochrysis_lutea.AAC.4
MLAGGHIIISRNALLGPNMKYVIMLHVSPNPNLFIIINISTYLSHIWAPIWGAPVPGRSSVRDLSSHGIPREGNWGRGKACAAHHHHHCESPAECNKRCAEEGAKIRWGAAGLVWVDFVLLDGNSSTSHVQSQPIPVVLSRLCSRAACGLGEFTVMQSRCVRSRRSHDNH